MKEFLQRVEPLTLLVGGVMIGVVLTIAGLIILSWFDQYIYQPWKRNNEPLIYDRKRRKRGN